MMPDIMVGPGLSDIFRILAANFGSIHVMRQVFVDGLANVGIEFANEAMLGAKFGNFEFLLIIRLIVIIVLLICLRFRQTHNIANCL